MQHFLAQPIDGIKITTICYFPLTHKSCEISYPVIQFHKDCRTFGKLMLYN